MAKFTDCLGREWSLRITTGLLRPLREAGFDPRKALTDPAAVPALSDPEALHRVLWVLCGRDAKAAGVTEGDFGEAFDGDTIYAAVNALVEAVLDFSPTPAAAKAAMKKVLPGVIERQEKLILARVEAIGSSDSAGSAPGSPASTPES